MLHPQCILFPKLLFMAEKQQWYLGTFNWMHPIWKASYFLVQFQYETMTCFRLSRAENTLSIGKKKAPQKATKLNSLVTLNSIILTWINHTSEMFATSTCTIWFGNCTLGYVPRGNNMSKLKRYLLSQVYCSLFLRVKDIDSVQVFNDG